MYKFDDRKCTLLENGQSKRRIVKVSEPSPSEAYAVEEFVKFFHEMTGVTLPVG